MSGWPRFFTATILYWSWLLEEEKYKMIIIDSLRFLVREKMVKLFGFVVMSNHIHLIWQMREGFAPESVQRDFLKYTAQKIKADLRKSNTQNIEIFFVNSKDRKFQFWKSNALSIHLYTPQIFLQKLNYIHLNRVRAKFL